MKQFIGAGLGVAAVVGAFVLLSGGDDPSGVANAQGAAIVEVALPDTYSTDAQIGQQAYNAKCAACHGINAVGQVGTAPPLIHKIYEPGHHGDEAFQRAAAVGVRQHHWRFGNMPPVAGITRGEVAMIVAYIRELQRFNGIN